MEPPSVRLQVLGVDVLQALVDGDAEAAGVAAGIAIPAWFVGDPWLWTLRLGQLIGEPEQAPWLIRAVVAPEGMVVGHAGFHGPPDGRGMVEVGYEIAPEHRRRGYARGAVAALISYARAHGVTVVRAAVSPDNAPSLALVAALGFVRTGEQMDEIDGLELVFERQI